ncbi:MAG TPA: sugar ABC transporter substrate-binding protein [Terriglobales bacterium]|nr:sugar ABC transporter substrate-binding protein [Terriglobales bacterium]
MRSNIGRRTVRLAIAVAVAGLSAASLARPTLAEGYDDGLMSKYNEALKGKKVAFVPISMSFDIPQVYALGMQAQAKAMGYSFEVRDPNWKVDDAVQAVNQLIQEKPDVIVVQPFDSKALDRTVRKAQEAGIMWLWTNVKTTENGDAYVGNNYFKQGSLEVQIAADRCGAGTSQKIAIVESPPNISSTIGYMAGITDALKAHPELKLVATQTAEADASKAKSIAATILKQHPDLCAFIGLWDGEDIGIPPAVQEAGLTGKVNVITVGAGSQVSACDLVAKGAFTAYVSYDVADQVHSINDAIATLLQQRLKPGSHPFALYTHEKVLTKDTLQPGSCWNMDDEKKLVLH